MDGILASIAKGWFGELGSTRFFLVIASSLWTNCCGRYKLGVPSEPSHYDGIFELGLCKGGKIVLESKLVWKGWELGVYITTMLGFVYVTWSMGSYVWKPKFSWAMTSILFGVGISKSICPALLIIPYQD